MPSGGDRWAVLDDDSLHCGRPMRPSPGVPAVDHPDDAAAADHPIDGTQTPESSSARQSR
ncbi:hypothetical protein [Phytohabitans aurantiacus]|uniref:hypothetical protein n=1 Tax=Phytohabitans aurantiacus TaxID=3016789 RepID=UPI002492F4BB|nr:hypothetical protein [Phytohabitans aurantiacus]